MSHVCIRAGWCSRLATCAAERTVHVLAAALQHWGLEDAVALCSRHSDETRARTQPRARGPGWPGEDGSTKRSCVAQAAHLGDGAAASGGGGDARKASDAPVQVRERVLPRLLGVPRADLPHRRPLRAPRITTCAHLAVRIGGRVDEPGPQPVRGAVSAHSVDTHGIGGRSSGDVFRARRQRGYVLGPAQASAACKRAGRTHSRGARTLREAKRCSEDRQTSIEARSERRALIERARMSSVQGDRTPSVLERNGTLLAMIEGIRIACGSVSGLQQAPMIDQYAEHEAFGRQRATQDRLAGTEAAHSVSA
ncbi:predicted protein [Postia placenta Mad-698-R]|nr:predicted protein [Postia placenta Mad-698-R]